MRQTTKILSKITDSWKQLLSFLPEKWEEKCQELGAFRQKLRKFSGPEAILHTLMIHILGGYSLRKTKAVAKAGAIADVSDVAVLKRLRRAGEWLRWMVQGMISKTTIYPAPSWKELGMNIRLIDATHISEPGSKGSNYRIHYAFDLITMHCAQAKVTDYKTGETFKNFDIEPKTLYIADRGLYSASGIEHVCKGKADVLVRMSMKGPILYHLDGKRFGIWKHLRSLKTEAIGDWRVKFKIGDKEIQGRVCAMRKNRIATRHARQEVIHEYQRKGKRVSEVALEAARYIIIFTTLTAPKMSAEAALELYRGRWQIELVFKRMKSILGIGHLHKKDQEGIIAWLYGKLLCALLVERLLQTAEFFFPQEETPLQMAA